ncbi:hypothetical protein K438DRAFT_1936861 [Mycena galopus ATCC 62051]|nr:hypothetical protein K438DRAFT_1936861 [Mycena galopus ATCC 62051]
MSNQPDPMSLGISWFHKIDSALGTTDRAAAARVLFEHAHISYKQIHDAKLATQRTIEVAAASHPGSGSFLDNVCMTDVSDGEEAAPCYQLVNLRARPQALGPRGQALGLTGQARPSAGPERAQGLGLRKFKPQARASSPGFHTISIMYLLWFLAGVLVYKDGLSALGSGPGLSRGLGLEALLAGLGLGLENLKPRPAQAGPKPGPPGQAGP